MSRFVIDNRENGFYLEYDTKEYPNMKISDTRFGVKVDIDELDLKQLPKDHIPPNKLKDQVQTFHRDTTLERQRCGCDACKANLRIEKNSPTAISIQGMDDESEVLVKGEFHKLNLQTFTKKIVVQNGEKNKILRKNEEDGVIKLRMEVDE